MTGRSYVYVCDLAAGGMGLVELVVQREGRFERLWARKRLHPHLRTDPDLRAMFMDEARLAGLVRHPNVVSVVDVGDDGDGPFLIMELVEGVPASLLFAQAAEQDRPLPVQVAVRVALEAARGLHAAHETRWPDGEPLSLVHRDVSLQNLLVGFDGSVRVTDFGIAKALGAAARTTAGVLKGNVGYLSPEQLRFEPLDRRSDLFSLGVVLFELLTARRLYHARDAAEGPRRILNEPPPDVGQYRRDVPPALAELLFELLSKDRTLRPATAGDVAGRLEQILGELIAEEGAVELPGYMRAHFGQLAAERKEDIARRLRTVGSRRQRRWAPVAGAVIAALAGAAVLWPRAGPRVAPGASRTLWAGGWHSCALDAGRLVCWGKNNEGQLGVGNTDDRPAPTPVAGIQAPLVSVAGGAFHTCACASDGHAVCWGRNREGQLGGAPSDAVLAPRRVPDLADCVQIAAGERHSCALRAGGRVVCWGANERGQRGEWHDPSPARIVQIDLGGNSGCVVEAGGRVLCWGDNQGAQLGDGTAGGFRERPAPVTALDDAAEVAVGAELTCARRRGGQIACWGTIGEPKMGVRPPERVRVPRAIAGLEDAVALTVGASHACALTRAGQLRCFGSNFLGQLGTGGGPQFFEAGIVPMGLGHTVAMDAGDVHTCARHQRGVSCWGVNATGQLGDGTEEERRRPVSVIGLAR